MTHVRTQIRAAVVAALAGRTSAGSRVKATRLRPQAADALPALAVFTPDESADVAVQGAPAQQARTLTLHVVGDVRAPGDRVDDALDALAAEVETAMFAADLSGLLLTLDLTRTETAFDAAADQPLGSVRLTFAAAYRTREGAPETAI